MSKLILKPSDLPVNPFGDVTWGHVAEALAAGRFRSMIERHTVRSKDSWDDGTVEEYVLAVDGLEEDQFIMLTATFDSWANHETGAWFADAAKLVEKKSKVVYYYE